MPVPVRQRAKLAWYLAKQRMRGVEKFPLVVELEPLFACNLACAGCGKIQYPAHILKQRMSVGQAVAAIKEAKRRGFRVTTNSTFFSHDTPKGIRDCLDFLNDDLEVDAMMISPAYAYWKAPDQDHFMGVEQTRALFKDVFAGGTRKKWRLNHSPLFLDFLEGKVDYECTPWGIPAYSMFGWQGPGYLQADGYAKPYKELVDTTDWSQYGRHSGNVQCRNCMAHCGYEPTAVMATTKSLKESIRALVNS